MRRTRSPARPVASRSPSSVSLLVAVPRAHAEPSTNERRKVAEEVADSVCAAVAAHPEAAGDGRSASTSAAPSSSRTSIRRATTAAYAPLASGAATIAQDHAAKFCADSLDKLLDPARQLFLDKVVPAAQQLACVTSAPAAFDCIAQQMHVWLKQSIISLWQGLITVLTADTKVIGLIDGWRNTGVVSLYSDVGGLGATLLLGLMLVSLIISAIRFDFRQFGSTLLGVIVWGLFWSGGAIVAVLLLKASDDASRWLAGPPGRDRADGPEPGGQGVRELGRLHHRRDPDRAGRGASACTTRAA